MAQTEDIVLIHEGKPIGYLVGFADEDDWIDPETFCILLKSKALPKA